jgi:hypothetical protein
MEIEGACPFCWRALKYKSTCGACRRDGCLRCCFSFSGPGFYCALCAPCLEAAIAEQRRRADELDALRAEIKARKRARALLPELACSACGARERPDEEYREYGSCDVCRLRAGDLAPWYCSACNDVLARPKPRFRRTLSATSSKLLWLCAEHLQIESSELQVLSGVYLA